MFTELYLLLAIFVVAILYSSVGHGGASGYIAIMILMGMNTDFVRHAALLLNLIVSGIAFYTFYKSGNFSFKSLFPFIITSIPASFIGAQLSVNIKVYKVILAIFLLLAVIKMLISFKNSSKNYSEPPLAIALVLGLFIGLLSGLMGIGGGVILSPILIFFNWADIKKSAGVSAAFIFVNSAAGIISLSIKGVSYDYHLIFFVAVAILGGMIGSWLGSKKLSPIGLKYVLSFVLFFAACKLL